MRLVLALALALGAAAPPPTPESTPPPAPTLDVVVEDARGRTVETLGPADFSVTEQSRPLAIDSVRFVRAPGTPTAGATPVSIGAPAQAPNADGARVIAIYLDEFHLAPGPAAEAVRRALISFVNEDVRPSDRLVVL